jgi:hypothetical protein
VWSIHYYKGFRKWSKLIDRQKQAELQWLEKPNQLNGDNLQNVGCETRKYLGKEKGIFERQK